MRASSASRSITPSASTRDDRAADRLDRVQHRVVLDRAADGTPARRGRRADDGQVVGLGAGRGEHDLAGLRTERLGDRVAGLVDRACRAARATACAPDGLPNRSVRNGSIAATASGRIGVVAAWSR